VPNESNLVPTHGGSGANISGSRTSYALTGKGERGYDRRALGSHGRRHSAAQWTLEPAARARTPGLFDDWTNAHSARSSVGPSTTVMRTPFATR